MALLSSTRHVFTQQEQRQDITLNGAHPEFGGVQGGLARIEEDTKKGHPMGAPQSINF